MARAALGARGALLGGRADLATLLGLAGGLVLIAVAIAWGGRAWSFVEPAALLIVLGGTAAVTTISFSVADVARVPLLLRKTLESGADAPAEAVARLVRLAEQARRDGLLSLDDRLPLLADQPLLQRGVALVVDGATEDDVARALELELNAMAGRHQQAAGVLRRAAEVAPAMGLIGTLIGLVQMLGRLEDPSSIGPAMAVALLTTFYGAVLGHMVLTPLAVKLEGTSQNEVLRGEMQILAVQAIRRRVNPRQLQAALNGLLPPRQRQGDGA
jgi:chemotaxis protein MotA